MFHHHVRQDEFVYISEGTLALLFGEQGYLLNPGDCIGFKAGNGIGHQLMNRSSEPVFILKSVIDH